MTSVEVTLSRALKIWWSYTWRAFVLLIPLMAVLDIAMFFILPIAKPGHPFAPDRLSTITRFGLLIWLPGMVASLALQAQAMRWMLKTRWSGFRLQVVTDD